VNRLRERCGRKKYKLIQWVKNSFDLFRGATRFKLDEISFDLIRDPSWSFINGSLFCMFGLLRKKKKNVHSNYTFILSYRSKASGLLITNWQLYTLQGRDLEGENW
jgi:hypothetical protein